MNRFIATAAAVALAATLPYAAFAQSGKAANPSNQSAQAEIKKALEAAGFKDVKVEPRTFAVRANDPAGSPVMMVIGPNTFGPDTELDGQQSRELSPNVGSEGTPTPKHSADDEQATGSLPNVGRNYAPNLTPGQKQEIWQSLSSVKTMQASKRKDFAPKVGAIIPYGVSVEPLPDEIANTAPSLEGYHYAMMQKEIVIVHPTSKKIVEVIKEQ
jgi:Protein of unknown function (DUF1236)